jgi:hypothetical protein
MVRLGLEKFGIHRNAKSKEGRKMTKEAQRERKLRRIQELARGWGKLLAEQAFPQGVGLDVDLATMEDFASTAAKALVGGAIETMTCQQASALEEAHPCPECHKRCELEHRRRRIQVRGGEVDLAEPVAHCSTCRRDFFPSASPLEAGRSSL